MISNGSIRSVRESVISYISMAILVPKPSFSSALNALHHYHYINAAEWDGLGTRLFHCKGITLTTILCTLIVLLSTMKICSSLIVVVKAAYFLKHLHLLEYKSQTAVCSEQLQH